MAVLAALFPAAAGAGAQAHARAAAKPGALDRAFAKGGRLVADFGTEPAHEAEAEKAIATADGGLLVLSNDSITKYRGDGSVDHSFGRGGSIVRVEWVTTFATDPQGRIVVVSSVENPAGTVVLERFRADGTLDGSFGAGGTREVKIARGRMGNIASLLIGSDGKLLLIGSGYGGKTEGERIGAMRLLPGGAVDRGFGDDGCASVKLPGTPDSGPNPIATLDDEDLILAASAARSAREPNFFAARFDPAGNLDPGFGTGGIVRSHIVDWPIGIAAGADGRITVVDAHEQMGRLLADGSPDPSFGKDGTVAEEHPRGNAVAMALEADGSTLIANSTDAMSFMLERRLPDGSLDPGFGGGQGYAAQAFAAREAGEVRPLGLAPVPGRGALVYGRAPASGEPRAPDVIAAALFGPAGEQVAGFGAGGELLARPLVKSEDFGYDLLAGRSGVTVTGRAAGGALLRRYRPDGSVDRTFRGGAPTLPPSGAYFGDEGDALTAAPGGGFFLGTGASVGGGIYRFAPGGGLRSGFGRDGVARVPGLGRVLDVAPLKDGSLYVVGIALRECELELGRLRPDGSLDRSFGGRDGLRRIGYGAGPCTFHNVGLAARPAGAVVVGGETGEGILDEYAPSGRRLSLRRHHSAYLGGAERLRAVALDRRGRILLVGRTKHSLSVTRLTPAGDHDRTFGSGGVARVDVGSFAEGSGLVLEPNGRIVVAGLAKLCPRHTSCHGSSPLVTRLDPNGRLDRGFASGGVWTGKPGEEAGLKALALGPGSIYATGWRNRPHTGRDLLVLRLRR